MSRPTGALLALLVLLCHGVVRGTVADDLTVDPPDPVAGDVVTITGGGWMPDGCWLPEYTHECSIEGNTITLTFQTTDGWSGGLCLAILTPFSASCELGALPAGSYTVEVVEVRDSRRTPSPSTQSFEFEVTQRVAAHQTRWSTLKSTYRPEGP